MNYMLLTPHILAGMYAGSLPDNFVFSPILSILSYFFLEAIPHWDPENFGRKRVQVIHYIDFTFAIILYLVIIFVKEFDVKLVLGGLFSVLMYALFLLLEHSKVHNALVEKVVNFHNKLKYTDRSLWGVLIQVSVSVICFALLFNLIDFPTWNRIRENFARNFLQK